MKHHALLVILIVLVFSSCKVQDKDPERFILEENVNKHIQTLASDAFLGRKPGTKGEEKATQYLEDRLKKINIHPANGNSYFQEFTIQKPAFSSCSKLTIASEKGKKEYAYADDFYAKTSFKLNETVAVENTEMVYAGFGIVAPDYDWDDYKDIDVKGKIVVVLFSDPGFYGNDPEFFNGKQPTYYAGIRYKKREALKRGAAGLVMVYHETMDWDAIKHDTNAPLFIKGEPELASDGLKFSGIISIPVMNHIMSASGYDTDYIETALSKNSPALPLKTKASLSLQYNAKDLIKTKNVVGLLKGSKRPDEYIIYTAHWDHVGTRAARLGKDSIFNGAIDNASGTAMQLEVAGAFSRMKTKPERSVLFLFTSAEEMGLLGAEHYANNPLYPLHKTVCVINSDGSFAVEKMRVVINVIKGYTELDEFVETAAKKIGRATVEDTSPPEYNIFRRSDHYPFVKKGVPAVWNVGNMEPLNGDPKEEEKIGEYVRQHYHQVTDEFYEGFNGANITFDAQLNFLTGLEIANSGSWPNWNADSEYKKIRDESLLAKDR